MINERDIVIGRFYATDVKVVQIPLTYKMLKASGMKTRRIYL